MDQPDPIRSILLPLLTTYYNSDRFTSDYSFTFEFGGFSAKRAIELSGQESLLPKEVQNELAKRQSSSLTTSVYGNIEADVPNNIWLQTAKRFVLSVSGMEIDSPLDASNLVYYDLVRI